MCPEGCIPFGGLEENPLPCLLQLLEATAFLDSWPLYYSKGLTVVIYRVSPEIRPYYSKIRPGLRAIFAPKDARELIVWLTFGETR